MSEQRYDVRCKDCGPLKKNIGGNTLSRVIDNHSKKHKTNEFIISTYYLGPAIKLGAMLPKTLTDEEVK